jgi:phospholipid-binding lipoprotein MlaA
MDKRGFKLLAAFLVVSFLTTSTALAKNSDQAMGADNTFWKTWKKLADRYIPFEETLKKIKEPDPMEALNRKIFAFNDVADQLFLAPVARGYQDYTPNIVQQGFGNMLSNVLDISTVVNDLLQGKFYQAASDTGRLVVNSTLGIIGIFDVASGIGLEKHEEDFGQTLGYWGMPAGPYVMVPLFGPYTVRSGFGAFGDILTDLVGSIDHVPTRNQLWAGSIVDKRAALLGAEELITGDRYTFIRDAYVQQREFLVLDGAVVSGSFGDEVFEDWDETEE